MMQDPITQACSPIPLVFQVWPAGTQVTLLFDHNADMPQLWKAGTHQTGTLLSFLPHPNVSLTFFAKNCPKALSKTRVPCSQCRVYTHRDEVAQSFILWIVQLLHWAMP